MASKTQKIQNLRKTVKELLSCIEHRNRKIYRLLDENRYLRNINFEYYCALHNITGISNIKPYPDYTDPYIKELLEKFYNTIHLKEMEVKNE